MSENTSVIDVQVLLREALNLRASLIEEADDADESELAEHLEQIAKTQRGILALRQILSEELFVDNLGLEGDSRLDALMNLAPQG